MNPSDGKATEKAQIAAAARDPPVGEVLRALRQERGLRQEDVAEAAGLHHNTLSDAERGVKSPSVKTVGRILRVLGVTWSDFGHRLEEVQKVES
jgi:transcriptional regulator with XRE-family HTH domain